MKGAFFMSAKSKVAAKEMGVSIASIRCWVEQYKVQGEHCFDNNGQNRVYSNELKLRAVLDYLDGKESLNKIAAKYGLRSASQLKSWIKKYHNGEYFGRKMSGGSRMTKSRKVNSEERIKIVRDCIERNRNYGETARKYHVSYGQVYQWVKKYLEQGPSGLEDRRGKRKKNQIPRNREEELEIENANLKHQLYLAKVENGLLKKVRELERSDASDK